MDMFNISQQTAETVFGLSNVLTIVGTVLVVIGAVGVFWSGGIRERYGDERIAKTEALTATANKEAAEARLETERLRSQMAWRRLSKEQHDTIVSTLKGHKVELWNMFVGADPESNMYREDFEDAFKAAGITTKYFSGWERAVGLQVNHVPGPEFEIIVMALRRANIRFTLKEPTGPGLDGGELGILVGTKPPP